MLHRVGVRGQWVVATDRRRGHSERVSDHRGSFVVRPWYRQFYLRRGDAQWCSDRITDDGYARGLEAVDGFIYVGTTMYGSPTEVAVGVHIDDPGLHEAADRHADVVLEGDGDLAVLNWEPGEQPVTTVGLPSGVFSLRVSWFGTAVAAEHDDVESGGDDRSPEQIVLDLWPAPQWSS